MGFKPNGDGGQHGDGHHGAAHQSHGHQDKLQRDSHPAPPAARKATTGEGSGPPTITKPPTTGEGSNPPKKPSGGEGSGPPTTGTTGNPPGEGSGPPGEGTGPPKTGGHHEKTPPVIITPPGWPTIPGNPIVPPLVPKTPVVPTTEIPPTTVSSPEIPNLLPVPPVIPDTRTFSKDVTVTTAKPKDPGVVPPPPTGVFTGKGGDGGNMEARFKSLYTSGKYAAHAGEESLTSTSIGLNHVRVDAVGTGAEMHQKKHLKDMVPPRDPFHLGEWKHMIPGKTIIAGHVSFNGTPGPLYELKNLGVHKGVADQVTLEGKDGKKTTYQYAGREIVKDPKDQKTWNKVFAPGDPDHKQLVLVTCCGPVNSHGLHAWRLIDYLQEVPSKNGTTAASKPDGAGDKKGSQTVNLKFSDIPDPNLPIQKPIVSSSVSAPEKSTVSTNAVGLEAKTPVQTTPAETTVTSTAPALTPDKPLVTASTVTETHTPKNTAEIITNGTRTLVDVSNGKLGAGVGFTGTKLDLAQVNYTSTLLNNGRNYATNTVTGGFAFGSRLNTSKSLSITDNGPFVADQLYFERSLGSSGNAKNWFLYGTAGIGYQPQSHISNFEGYGGAGLGWSSGRWTLTGGLGDYGANHFSPTIHPNFSLDYKVTKSTSAGINMDGNTFNAVLKVGF